ncbi:hypothetical protein [[Flexibacter] sp. ATCC 35103]|uniref:hypothetical protein n=1 Tax=[Flexibacter] sp. ATCC 35103 TaxID=1937528 RepID=UPI0009CAEE1F|nr:hypothetical protein [[Flexibacter] sp. ATCC 35103]OMQ10942.1 hypothetical protein BXU01_11425 [[Flexibacter] sp. ATCC 35103]
MKTLNSIAIEYLLRNDSQKNNKSEDITREVIRINTEQNIKSQKSLLFHMYDLEEEAEEFFV